MIKRKKKRKLRLSRSKEEYRDMKRKGVQGVGVGNIEIRIINLMRV